MVEHERTGWVDPLTWSFSRIAMWMPAVVVAVIFYEVFTRYFLDDGTLWANELSLWMAGGIYLTSGLYALQQRSHIRIFILYDVVPRGVRQVFDTISTVCICIFAFAVIWGGYGEAIAKLMRWELFGTAWDPPIPATMKPLILVTVVLLAIQSVSNLICDWNTDPVQHDPADEVGLSEAERAALTGTTDTEPPQPGAHQPDRTP